MTKLKKGLFFFIFTFISFGLGALQSFNNPVIRDENSNFSISITPSYLFIDGTSDELVYPRFKSVNPYLSQLIWNLEEVRMAGSSVALNYKNEIFLNGAFWHTLNEGSGTMQDYDWFYNNLDQWTHRSNHNIFLNPSYAFDLNGSYRFLKRGISLAAVLGIKQQSWSWKDEGEDYTYTSTSVNSTYTKGAPMRNLNGSFNSEPGISYDVVYSTPYVGLSIGAELSSFIIQGLLTYSPFAFANDHDHHIMRGLHYYDNAQLGQTIGLAAQGQFYVTPTVYLNLGASYHYLFETTGDLRIFTENDTYLGIAENQAGFRYEAFSCSLAVGYVL